MKTINLSWFLFWLVLLGVVAFFVGRHIERLAAYQKNADDLDGRVRQLETHQLRREERQKLISKCISWIPVVKRFFHHD